ncbi:hypothetical protein VQ02_02710 [Methylobacterium variabile]|uniref:Methyltransferase type 12 domain-containing protein n=1 Tax=Methylobacterium variabile TaxID=298794 RepID=A0A0J6T9Q1_9HYPH|nr:methyltransferase [Methylobacterium variabile]KMO42599.1 hypothetical protein VQ02_02710 [Methylobacterium variabile]
MARRLAEDYGVRGDIHDHDYIYWYAYDALPDTDKAGAVYAYLEGGRTHAEVLRDLLEQHRPARPDFSLLDFASGYGRVSRHLAKMFPEAGISACDIHPDAVAFLNDLGIPAHLSTAQPEAFSLPDRYDVIFALSFFTHLPKATWGPWLYRLSTHLAPGGLLVFSAHGAMIWPKMDRPPLDEDSFSFVSSSEQKDISGDEYGNCATMIDFVSKVIREYSLHLEGFRSPGIDLHDIYVIRAVGEDLMVPSLHNLRRLQPRRRDGVLSAIRTWLSGP